jgi:hypothetical protein
MGSHWSTVLPGAEHTHTVRNNAPLDIELCEAAISEELIDIARDLSALRNYYVHTHPDRVTQNIVIVHLLDNVRDRVTGLIDEMDEHADQVRINIVDDDSSYYAVSDDDIVWPESEERYNVQSQRPLPPPLPPAAEWF